MEDKLSRQLGLLLVEDGVLAADDMEHALKAAASAAVPFPEHLVSGGFVERNAALRSIAGRIGVGFYDPEAGGADPGAIQMVPAALAVSETALPIRAAADRVDIAVADPYDDQKLERLAAAAGKTVVPVLAPRAALDATVRRIYQQSPAEPSAGTGTAPPAQAEVVPLRAGEPSVPPSGEGTRASGGEVHINELLDVLMDAGGSDLHLTAGSPPQIRVNGDLQEISGYDRLMPDQLRPMIYSILTSRQREEFEEKLELDASHPVQGKGRFRVNVFLQRGSVGAVMRAIPNEIKTIDQLGLPAIVHEFADMQRGLVLVTGATGSGKSTTLASVIDEINTQRAVHIMTIEDPIEFMHRHKKSIVNQRELGADTTSFSTALRHALRQDPDVILVGELRDLETMATALTAAETGHLVFATLHTQDAPGSVERIIDVFPPHQQQQVRVQLASSLQGVVSQQLMPTVDGKARVAGIEVMVAVPAIRNLIREGKIHQIRSAMQAGGRHGMQTMDQSLAELVRKGKIDLKVAVERSHSQDEFMKLVGGNR
jgi:twitching motility protein PilT